MTRARTALLLALGCAVCLLWAGAAGAKTATMIDLTTTLAFGDDSTCTESPESPCPASGTFTADDAATARLVCPAGTIFETHWFTHGFAGPITLANRTWTCPDGSTLVMSVQRWAFVPRTDTTADILETWVITGGTGRLAALQGKGTMDEIFDFGSTPNTLGGAVTGVVR